MSKTLRIVITGPPASGKGTQGETMSKDYNLPIIGSGDILRAEARSGSEIGKKIAEVMAAGQLVSDELIIPAVISQLEARKDGGWILDGFPRSESQAHFLCNEIKKGATSVMPTHLLVLDAADEVVVERMGGRRIDPETKKVYHMKYLPPPPEIIPRLIIRDDDQEDKIKERLKIYHEATDKWIAIFEKELGLKPIHVNSVQEIDKVYEDIKKALL